MATNYADASSLADVPADNVILFPSTDQPLDDLDVAAAKAHAEVERTSDSAETELKANRVAWMTIGRIFDEKHAALNGSNNKFGEWVREQRLDTGRCRLSSVRSDAAWMWRNRAVLEGFKNDISHPTALRAAARRSGYLWAIEDNPAPKPSADSDGSPDPKPTNDKKHRSGKKKLFEVPEDELYGIPPELREHYLQMREREHTAEQQLRYCERLRERLKRKMQGINGVNEWLSQQEGHTVVRVLARSPHPDRAEALEIFGRVLPLLEG